MDNRFVLGMDGGGTSTSVMACKGDGTLLGKWEAGALNVNGQTFEKTAETVAEVMRGLEKRGLMVSDLEGVCAGVAGISNGAAPAVIKKALISCGVTGAIKLVGDYETALASEFEELWGAALIAGTGSVCYGKDAGGRSHRAGGYGHLIDDGGSAYAIGRDILKAVVRAVDGRGERTSLQPYVYQALGVKGPEELMTWLYEPQRTKKEIAALAVLAEKAARGGDRAAAGILETAACQLVELALAVLRLIPEADKILLSGSVLKNNEVIRRDFSVRLKEAVPHVTPVIMRSAAALGAVRLIRKELGYL